MKDVLDALKELDHEVLQLNIERDAQSLPHYPSAKIQILGQMSLVLNTDLVSQLSLFATQDVDAIIKGEWIVTSLFKRALEKRALQLDFLSSEIWLPPDAKYIPIFSGKCVECEILDPISALTSKAIKAPQKNHNLILDALKFYGSKLEENIKIYGGDPEEFKKKLKL